MKQAKTIIHIKKSSRVDGNSFGQRLYTFNKMYCGIEHMEFNKEELDIYKPEENLSDKTFEEIKSLLETEDEYEKYLFCKRCERSYQK